MQAFLDGFAVSLPQRVLLGNELLDGSMDLRIVHQATSSDIGVASAVTDAHKPSGPRQCG